jgi:hypothetical protein
MMQAPERQFSSGACPVTFMYPASWTIAIDTTASEVACRLVLRPIAWDSLFVEADSVQGVYTVVLEIMARRFEDAVPLSPFEQRDTGWVALGRLGLEAPATAIARGWRGVRGEAPYGCYRMGGGYVGACSWPVALVGDDLFTARIDGAPDSIEVFERVLNSLTFTPDG